VYGIIDLVGDALLDFLGDWSLSTRGLNAAQDLLRVKWHARAILLDDYESLRALDALVAGEALTAVQALTAAADDRP
jgi:hypothetical protein